MHNKTIRVFLIIVIILGISISKGNFSASANKSVKDELVVDVLSVEGDCVIVTYNDVEILIDSGTSDKDFEKIKNKMEDIMKNDDERKWDYLIFTHPHEDHIGNAVKIMELFTKGEPNWSLGTIVDYDFPELNNDFYKTDVAKEYRSNRQDTCRKTKAEYFTASSLSVNTLLKNFSLSDNCNLYILFNKYDTYDKVTDNGKNTLKLNKEPNLLSVCCLIKYKDNKILFTGDLPIEAEESLIYYHQNILDGVTLYKAAHHGSTTANSDELLEVIRPQYITVSRMSKANVLSAFSRFFKYNDYIYPTSVEYTSTKTYPELYGDEVFKFNGYNMTVQVSHNCFGDKTPYPLWDTYIDEYGVYWFATELDNESSSISELVSVYTFDEGKPTNSNCTLVKYGHYDILIDCGSSETDDISFVDLLSKYVVDKKIEYVIVSHYHVHSISQLIDTRWKKGVFSTFNIGTVIDGKGTNFESQKEDCVFYSEYKEKVKLADRNITIKSGGFEPFRINDSLSFSVFGNGNGDSDLIDENDYSLITIFDFHGLKMLFVGDLEDYTGVMENDNLKKKIKNVTFLRMSNSAVTPSNMKYISEFAELTKPYYIVIGTPIGYRLSNGKVLFSESSLRKIKNIFGIPQYGHLFFKGYLGSDMQYHYNTNPNENKVNFIAEYKGGITRHGME